MSASQIIFYLISALILGAGILSVTTRKIFRAAIWLLFSMIGVAALYFWMEVEFIAAVQVIVYVGGIVVLIIFSIFLTQKSGEQMPSPVTARNIFSVLAALIGIVLSYSLIYQYNFVPQSTTPMQTDVANIGTQLLSTKETGYALPFEVISILLLAAMIGCIVIAMKSKPEGSFEFSVSGREFNKSNDSQESIELKTQDLKSETQSQ